MFRAGPDASLLRSDRSKGGRLPMDAVIMFKVVVLALMHDLSDERMEFPIRDRFSWLRFPGFRIGEPTPDQKTIRPFREKLTGRVRLKPCLQVLKSNFARGDTSPLAAGL